MLHLVDLRKSFGTTVALDGLDLEVPEGQIVGFVGPNGAGKTTAMRCAIGILTPDSGQVTWRGAELDQAARARFGYMPEERGLYPKMAVGDQLEHLARLHGHDAAAARAAVADWVERVGLSARIADRVETLSLGNQQRAQLAAALVHGPELLVLDEPFSGLDPVGVDVLAGVLRERADAGVPIVFFSHQLDLVERVCDRVTIVRDGRVVAAGALDELRDAGSPSGWLTERFREVVAAS